jgi:phospholipid/cholesterol/gamma-HCH transport system substrate-binding protein
VSGHIRKHARDFAFIVGLLVLALIVGGYVLSQQRFTLPRGVPLIGSDFVTYRAQLASAQSVTPGQGQTVQVAGVDVGEIAKVDLVEGHAVVTMKIRRRFTPIYNDATALLRPKTGLNDMVLQLAPGSRSSGVLPEGGTIPISQTLPNVNFDEILQSLDADTRSYLQLLVGGGAQGLGGQGRRLSGTLKRFEPTGRALARLNGALARRQANIRRTIHNFSLLSQALGAKDDQLATLVDSSNRVFRAFADQDARLRDALRLLPGTLSATDRGLTKADALATELRPALGRLRPTARALGPALRDVRPFLADTTPVIRDQLRPFSRDVLPTVRDLRPAARDLADATPRLTTSLRVVNELLNELAYNPPGPEEGFLFWASWANHDGASIFSTQDAHGPVRRGLVVTSCTSLQLLANIGQANRNLGTLATLLNPPAPAAVCPGAAPGPTAPAPGPAVPAVPTVPPLQASVRAAPSTRSGG